MHADFTVSLSTVLGATAESEYSSHAGLDTSLTLTSLMQLVPSRSRVGWPISICRVEHKRAGYVYYVLPGGNSDLVWMRECR